MSSFGLGLAIGSIGSSLGNHHHYHDYYSDYHRPSYHYHSSTTYNNFNSNGNGNGNADPNNNSRNNANNANIVNTGNNMNFGDGTNNPSNNVNLNHNNYGNNFNNNNSTNAASLQNSPTNNSNNSFGVTERSPFQQPPPLVYSITAGQSDSNDFDSTEIIFTNPYLIVGVENLLLYGEFHDDADIKIVIQQESDGYEPYPWNQPNLFDEVSHATSGNSTMPLQNQPTHNETKIMNNEMSTTTTTEIASTTLLSIVDTSTKVPSIPLLS